MKIGVFRSVAFLFFVSVFVSKVNAQELRFHIPQLTNSQVYLARYFGPELYYLDSAKTNSGDVVFDGSHLTQGLYALILPGIKYFDFIHDHEVVEMTVADTSDHTGSLSVQKSKNNIAFQQFVQLMRDHWKFMGEMGEKYRGAEGNSKKQAAIDKKVGKHNLKLYAEQLKMAEENHGLFVEQIIRMSMQFELPESLKSKKGESVDSALVYNYYIDHFWDGVDLKNAGIVYTPVFHNKLETYFSPYGLMQNPDTLLKYAVLLLEQMDQEDLNNQVFQYTLADLMQKFENSPVPGSERVFMYLGREYYCSNPTKTPWMPKINLINLCDRLDKMGRIMVGNLAVPLILPDTTEANWINFYDLDAEYVILYFWDPNCGHCITTTPLLQKLYAQKFKERGIEIYAVAQATGDDFEDWKKFISEHGLTFINVGLTRNVYDQFQRDSRPLLKYTSLESLQYGVTYDVYSTPKVYVLDKDRHIIFKDLDILELESRMDELTGHAGEASVIGQ